MKSAYSDVLKSKGYDVEVDDDGAEVVVVPFVPDEEPSDSDDDDDDQQGLEDDTHEGDVLRLTSSHFMEA